ARALGPHEHVDQLGLLAVGTHAAGLRLGLADFAGRFRFAFRRGKSLGAGGRFLDSERLKGIRGGPKRQAAALLVLAPDGLHALGRHLLDEVLVEEAAENLGGCAAGKFGGERVDRSVRSLAGGRENDELGVGKRHGGGSLRSRAAPIAALLLPGAPAAIATRGRSGTLWFKCASQGVFALLEGGAGDALQELRSLKPRTH